MTIRAAAGKQDVELLSGDAFELEERVKERTRELEQLNTELKRQLDEWTRSADAQHQSQQQYESLVQSIDGIVWELDAATFTFTFVSKQAEKMLGYPVEQWLNEPSFWADHLHPDDRDWAINFCVRATNRKADHQFEYRMVASDGRLLWLRDIVTVHTMDDNSVRLRGVMVDITDYKQVEEERRKLLRELGERVKELTALHGATHILQQTKGISADALRQVASLIPPAFQYPEVTSARICLGPTESGPRFNNSASVLRADFTTADKQCGCVEVVYTDERPDETFGPFLAEERALIITLADMLRISYDRSYAEEQLRSTTQQLRALSARLQAAREEERTLIAREIHDELGSALTGLRWGLESLQQDLSKGANRSNEQQFSGKVEQMIKLTDDTVGTMRRISSDLRPSILDDFGLLAAIEWQAEQFEARTRIVCHVECSIENRRFTQGQSTALFRVFQEALTNILRHANAKVVRVTMSDEAGTFVLRIADDGKGISEAETGGQGSLGILGMRERVHLIDGEIEITGVKGQGTEILVRIPLPRD
jgi:PAS domain S-box-containing protein